MYVKLKLYNFRPYIADVSSDTKKRRGSLTFAHPELRPWLPSQKDKQRS